MRPTGGAGPAQRLTVYFVRHPRPAVAPGLCYGATDLGLSEDPEPVAAQVAARLPAGLPLFSSPLRRCRALAERLHPATVYDERLVELAFGAWELQPWTALPRAALEAWAVAPLDFTPPGGEPVRRLWARVAAFLAERRAAGGGAMVVVSHAGVLKALAAQLSRAPVEVWTSLTIDFGAVRRIEEAS